MRIFYLVIIAILLSGTAALAQQAQQKPLTQAEYVQLLYDLQKNPQKKDEIVETVRKRGISFVLTDGIRELTLSKSRSDETLKRTLEEANRRRQNPTAAQLPSESEIAEILAKAREAMKIAADEMPDFIARQTVSRSVSYAGTNNYVSLDKLVIAVRYSSEKGEQYQVLRINGTPVTAEEGGNFGGLDGTTSNGEFAGILTDMFKEEAKTKFEPIDTDVLLGHPCVVFNFEIKVENDRTLLISKRVLQATTRTGKKGRIWIARDNFRVLRLDYNSTDIPKDFPIKTVTKKIDYDWVEINKTKYLLPVSSDLRMTYFEKNSLLEDRNDIRFRNYQKYDVDIKLLDDDEPAEEEAPAKKP